MNGNGNGNNNYQKNQKFTDNTLCVVLDTFLNLKHLIIHNTQITLSRSDIPKKIGKLNKLESLLFNLSHIFYDFNISQVETWLQVTLPFLPPSLKIIKMNSCKVRPVYYDQNTMFEGINNMTDLITKSFKSVLPSLEMVEVDFSAGEEGEMGEMYANEYGNLYANEYAYEYLNDYVNNGDNGVDIPQGAYHTIYDNGTLDYYDNNTYYNYNVQDNQVENGVYVDNPSFYNDYYNDTYYSHNVNNHSHAGGN